MPEAVADPETVDELVPLEEEPHVEEDELLVADLLVEDVSIDGMCGVY